MGCSALLWGILFCISLHLAMRPGHLDLKGTRISWRPLNKEWGTSPKVRGNIHSLYSQQYQASAGSICWSKFPVKIGVVSSSCWVGSPVGLRKWCPLLRWSMLYLRIPQCFRSGTCTTLGTAVEIGELFSTANSKLQDRQPGVELKHPFKNFSNFECFSSLHCGYSAGCLVLLWDTLPCLKHEHAVLSFQGCRCILFHEKWTYFGEPSLTKGRRGLPAILCDVPRKWVGLRMGQCPQEANAWLTKKLNKSDLGGFEPPKLGSANAEASETQRRIQWATDPAWLAELCPFFNLWIFVDQCAGRHKWPLYPLVN